LDELADAGPSEQQQNGERRQEQGHRSCKDRVEARTRAIEGVGEEGGWEKRAAEESGAPPSADEADWAEEERGEENGSVPVAVAHEGSEEEGEQACAEIQEAASSPLTATPEVIGVQMLRREA